MQNESSGNAAVEKSFEFAVRITNLYKYMVKEHKEYVLSRQLLRSGTSIGANVAEAQELILLLTAICTTANHKK